MIKIQGLIPNQRDSRREIVACIFAGPFVINCLSGTDPQEQMGGASYVHKCLNR